MKNKILIFSTAVILESVFYLFYIFLTYHQISVTSINFTAIVFYVLSGFLVLLFLRFMNKNRKGSFSFIQAFYMALLILISPLVFITLLKFSQKSDFFDFHNFTSAIEWINYLVPFVFISFIVSLRYLGKR